ncbi:GAF domain-containing protein [Acaryochloris sp. IP29b_bin.148]|uniref:GAF domain-containing protein n=1 Tax=Acaryochloris sp. IP29b_bin.148 TaxID=2969218 RepID=UPI00260CAEBE|nr:GAF domain-containing protein [Acaryochloris sp. IP29b_bin.148]
MTGVIALSMLPILVVGTGTYFTSETLHQQLSTSSPTQSVNDAQVTLKHRIPLLLMGTGAMALLAGSLAIWLINRELHPLLKAAQDSNQLVNRLYRQETGSEIEREHNDALLALANNIQLIDAQIPSLMHSQEHEAARAELLMQFIGQLHVALSAEDLLKTAVEEVRHILQTDRVTIFALNPDGDGTFVAESVAPGYPKLQWSALHDPCFSEGYQEQYRQGRVRAIDNIYNVGLNDCHIGLLERFAVKANIVAPILQKEELYGLLIAHQCARPRDWNPSEIELFRQLASQVGYALDQTRTMSQLDGQVNQLRLLMQLTQQIRGSLQTEEILTTTVQESRKVLRADRVIVYSIDEHGYGTVAAEATQPGIPKMLWAKISDPCFAEGYIEKYRAGRVQALSNVHEAGLTDCHLQQLKTYGVYANLVVPILTGEDLFGLLIAHQCSGPRSWQPTEIDLFTQIGTQVGYALAQANVLTQTEQAWNTNITLSHTDSQQLQRLHSQLLEYLQVSQPTISTWVQETRQHLETAQSVYTQLQTLIDLAQNVSASTRQVQSQSHQLLAQVDRAQDHLHQYGGPHHPIQTTAQAAVTQLQQLEISIQQLARMRTLVSQLSSQIHLQAMNIAAKATQVPPPDLSSVAINMRNVAQKLDDNMIQMKPLMESLQSGIQQETALLAPLVTGVGRDSPSLISEQLSASLDAAVTQLNTQAVDITQWMGEHIQTSTDASRQAFTLTQVLQRLLTQAQAMQTLIQDLETIVATQPTEPNT